MAEISATSSSLSCPADKVLTSAAKLTIALLPTACNSPARPQSRTSSLSCPADEMVTSAAELTIILLPVSRNRALGFRGSKRKRISVSRVRPPSRKFSS